MPSDYFKVSIPETTVVESTAGKVLQQLTYYPFGKGDLTSDGVQYSDEVLSTSTVIFTPVETVTIDNACPDSIKEIQMYLSAEFKATSSTTADIQYQWQGRNSSGTWIPFHDAATEAALGTVYVNATQRGTFPTTTNFDSMPIDLRLIFLGTEASEGYSRTKNTSYIKVLYVAD